MKRRRQSCPKSTGRSNCSGHARIAAPMAEARGASSNNDSNNNWWRSMVILSVLAASASPSASAEGGVPSAR
eukprot:CAMPEP_0185809934 /NCGR_PEP_ID=MMETSP1322-20130828/6492_1 /TAXON_ID=265543 /ORGANISM="Minutocellus polymorphus, Strain RCC2270" /LENGTH=71 /DNA_ID=CAMNT_0028506227 /DNA_START=57 /DNA_END=269 /DNA_ORIENTATION=-